MTGTGSLQGGSGTIGAEAEERALSYAKDVLRQGMPRAAVEDVLRAQGFDPAAASAIVERANKTKDERRVAGRRHMIMGAVVCVIGIVITVWSYAAAEEARRRQLCRRAGRDRIWCHPVCPRARSGHRQIAGQPAPA